MRCDSRYPFDVSLFDAELTAVPHLVGREITTLDQSPDRPLRDSHGLRDLLQ
jgi:hypothetical protein